MAENAYSGTYVRDNKALNLQILKDNFEYSHSRNAPAIKTIVDKTRAEEIKAFFSKTDIPAEWLDKSKTNWERSVAVATWIAKNIQHANPDPWPEHKNCIDLYKWNKEHQTGFNCRCHAIMLHELLLTADIENRFITCMPKDTNDPDCHVVNLIWLPELNKWAMLDSDEKEYTVDDNGTPLSLQEMRSYLINEKPFSIKPLEGFTINEEYLKAYWCKNLYRFHSHTMNGYNLEDTADGSFPEGDKLFHLFPDKLLRAECDSDYYEKDCEIFTSSEEDFWGTK